MEPFWNERMRHCVGGVLGFGMLMLALGACGSDTTSIHEAAPPEKPTSLPSYSSLSLYSADSPLNQPVPDTAEIDPNSAHYIALFDSVVQEDGFVIELKQYSTPVYIADPETPKVEVALHCGSQWAGVSSLVGVPIPSFAEPAQDTDGGYNPIVPGQCGEDASQDNQMVILDLGTRCEYDFWQMRREGDGWAASWGNSISMDSRGIYEKGFSARGSGFTQLSGQIWPDELGNGRISHALIFSYALTAEGGPVPPATETDGTSGHEWALPEGALLRLDPELDLDGLNLRPYERIIAQALQDYGMYLVDTSGSGASIEAIDPRSVQGDPYEGLLPDEDYPSIANIPADRFQVLSLPPQDAASDEKSELTASGCATFH